jgi:transmembrane sensor
LNDHANDKLARHVRVDVSDARIDRLWSGIAARLPRSRPSRRWVWAGATVCALAAAILVARVVRPRPDLVASAWEGASLETAAAALSVALVDGSRLTLDPNSRVEVGDRTASAVRLVLARGRIGCDVTHRPHRSFVVVADGVEVHVVGTRFSVSTEHSGGTTRVEVRVERGVVEVRGTGSSDGIARVEAGRSWSQVTPTGPLPGVQGEAPSATPAERHVRALPTPETPRPPAPDTAPESGVARAIASPASSSSRARLVHVSDARELFEHARGLWRSGRIQNAADTYQTLLTTYPRDPRAGLAAFELGRLRMDRLGDVRGAVRALEQAVALAPGAELREDAMARLAAANAGAHDPNGCARVRDRYLNEYPTGVHRRTVAAACGTR